jgi:hypothetical protein
MPLSLAARAEVVGHLHPPHQKAPRQCHTHLHPRDPGLHNKEISGTPSVKLSLINNTFSALPAQEAWNSLSNPLSLPPPLTLPSLPASNHSPPPSPLRVPHLCGDTRLACQADLGYCLVKICVVGTIEALGAPTDQTLAHKAARRDLCAAAAAAAAAAASNGSGTHGTGPCRTVARCGPTASTIDDIINTACARPCHLPQLLFKQQNTDKPRMTWVSSPGCDNHRLWHRDGNGDRLDHHRPNSVVIQGR